MPLGAGRRELSRPRRARPWRALAAACITTALFLPAAVAPSSAVPSRADLRAAQERLHELERDFQLSSERYNHLNEKLTALQAEIAVTERDVRRIERRLRARRASAVALAVELYKGGTHTAGVEAVLSSESIADIETRLSYLRASESAHNRVFERVAVDRMLLVEKVTELEDARARVARDRAAAARTLVPGCPSKSFRGL
jgi:peptidoglycan hydrolase CwlO-like protein